MPGHGMYGIDRITAFLQENRRKKIDGQISRALISCEEADEFIGYAPVQFTPTVLDAVRLHYYNAFSGNTTYEPMYQDLGTLEERMMRLNRRERAAMHRDNPLPPIGFELEPAFQSQHEVLQTVLSRFGIPYDMEGNVIDEIHPSPSYSAWTQARLLHELIVLNAVPLANTEKYAQAKNKGKVSLHLNFGVPDGIKVRHLKRASGDIYLLVNLYAMGFSSPERLLSRKTITSVDWQKKAEKSEKTPQGLFFGISEDMGDDDSERVRLEIRPGEFGNSLITYPQMVQTQLLCAMLFSEIKLRNGLPMTKLEGMLARLWDSGQQDDDCATAARTVLSKVLNETQMTTAFFDGVKTQYEHIVHQQRVKDASREVFARYAVKAGRIISQHSRHQR